MKIKEGGGMDILEEDYQKAVAVVRKCLSGSVSNLQRKLYWGYGRAASAIDRMQDEFIVSPMSASGRRDVYPEEIHELWKELQAAKAQAVPEWIETAIQPPEEGQKVIISGIYGVGIAEFSYLYKDEFVMYDMGASNPILSKDQVKFWQPLPDAPQEPTND